MLQSLKNSLVEDFFKFLNSISILSRQHCFGNIPEAFLVHIMEIDVHKKQPSSREKLAEHCSSISIFLLSFLLHFRKKHKKNRKSQTFVGPSLGRIKFVVQTILFQIVFDFVPFSFFFGFGR